MEELRRTGKVLIDFPFIKKQGGAILDKVLSDGNIPIKFLLENILQDKDMEDISIDIIEEKGIDFRSTDKICNYIRKKHPDLFKGQDKLFNIELQGNHDNFLDNYYWPYIAPNKYRNNPLDKFGFLKQDTSGARQKKQFDILLGEGNTIWVEHGHAYDWHNNNRDWWLREHGFEVVHSFIYGKYSQVGNTSAIPFVISLINQEKIKGGYFAAEVGDFWSDICDYEMRLPQIRRTEDIFREQNLAFYLVVMGHTHDPALIASRRGELWMDESIKTQYLSYIGARKNIAGFGGSYYWTEEKDSEFYKKYGVQ